MHDLIIRSLQGRTDPVEEETLRAWRDASEENEDSYRSLERLWSLTGRSSLMLVDGESSAVSRSAIFQERHSSPPVESEAPPALRGPQAPLSKGLGDEYRDAVIPRRTRAEHETHGPSRGSLWRRHRLKAAVLAAFLVPMGLVLAMRSENRRANVQGSTPGEVVTGSGEMTTLTLLDGTNVRLGPLSRLRLSREGRNQVVELEGRAFFGVTTDPFRDFIVRTAFGEASALGTRFEVRSEEDELRVLVVEGSVRVSSGSVAAEVRAGEMSRSRPDEKPTTTRVDDVYTYLDWMGNTLVFHATPLERALDEVGRRYGLPIEIQESSLTKLTVTATFTDQSVNDVISVLCQIVRAECAVEEDRVRIGGPKPVFKDSTA